MSDATPYDLNPGGAIIPFFQRYDTSHLDRYKVAVERIPRSAVRTYLDFGCGYGFGTAYLARRFPGQSIGLDADDECIRYARNRYSREGLQFYRIDSVALPVEGQSVSLLTAFDVIEHLTRSQAKEFFSEARRVLTSGGLLVGTTPNAGGRGHADLVYHLQEFTGSELQDLMTCSGLAAQIWSLGSTGPPRLSPTGKVIEHLPTFAKRSKILKILQSLILSIRAPRSPDPKIKPEVSEFQPNQTVEILFVANGVLSQPVA